MGPWPLDPRGAQAESIASVYWIMFAFAIVVLAIVTGALFYAGVRFRERPGHEARQFHGHNMLELTWTVIPTVLVVSFSLLSWQRLNIVNDVDRDAAMTLKVEGRQWSWTITYPDAPMFKALDGKPMQAGEQIDIPVGKKIKLELTAHDVIHSFWIPNLGGKKDAVPGHVTTMWLEAKQPGTYKGQCTEFCGDGHADMLLTVVAHPEGEYAAWASKAVEDYNRLIDPKTRVGRDTFLASACVGCHTVKGTQAAGKVGPELTHIASKKDIAGVLSPIDQANLVKWITNARAVKPGTQMPTLGCSGGAAAPCLSDQQINDIAQWLLTLK